MSENSSAEPDESRREKRAMDDDIDLQQGGDEPELVDESSDQPDVYLNVPVLKVDEISLEVEDLRARVSLQAEVLDLLKLNVGVDATLGRVALEIKGVEAQALLKVRLDNVASIVDRVLKTIDRNPQILEHVTRGLESAAKSVGEGASEAVKQVGEGAGQAVENVGEGTGDAVKQVGQGAGEAVENVGEGTGDAVKQVGQGAGQAVENVGEGTGDAVKQVGQGAGQAVENVGEGTEKIAESAGNTVEQVGRDVGETAKAVEDDEDSSTTRTRGTQGRSEGKARRTDRTGRPARRQTSGETKREPPKQARPRRDSNP